MRLARRLHRALDGLAVWLEDRVPRAAAPFRPGPEGPLDAFGPLPATPLPPAAPATWRFPAPPWGGPAGDQVEVRLLPARGPRRGTAILVPPWKNAAPHLWRRWSEALRREGMEVWHLVPPLHLGRSPGGIRSGEAFLSPDLGAVRAALGETVREVRMLAAAAARLGPVGLVGLSLGALAAAHAATGPEPLAFAALVAPPVDLAWLLGATPVGDRYQRLAARAGAPFPPDPELRRLLQPLSPLGRRPGAARLLVAAGIHDAIVPPAGPAALARSWGLEARLFPRGHATLLLACRALRQEVARLARAS